MNVVVNLKAYKEATGKNALRFLKLPAIVCLQPGDLYLAHKHNVWAQHVDAVEYGSRTGWILPEQVKSLGVKGTLINHSEHPLSLKQIKATVKRCKEVGLKTIVLVPNASLVKKVKLLHPDIIGIEPPELIGSKTNSVASRPELIKSAVKYAGKIPLYIGAGIKSREDVVVGKKCGAKGVIVSSAVVLAKNPAKVVKELTL